MNASPRVVGSLEERKARSRPLHHGALQVVVVQTNHATHLGTLALFPLLPSPPTHTQLPATSQYAMGCLPLACACGQLQAVRDRTGTPAAAQARLVPARSLGYDTTAAKHLVVATHANSLCRSWRAGVVQGSTVPMVWNHTWCAPVSAGVKLAADGGGACACGPIHGKQLARVRRVGRIEDGGTTQHNVLVVADRELGVCVGHVAAHVTLVAADTVRGSPTH